MALLKEILSKICGHGSTDNSGTTIEPVTNDEQLYRRVPNCTDLFKFQNGKRLVSSSAFNDRNKTPSVDRAKLRNSPSESKAGETDGIFCLISCDIRNISTLENTTSNDGEPKFYYIDVIPRPISACNKDGLAENLAHAQIEATPHLKISNRFKKLKEYLAIVAKEKGYWIIEPS